MAVIFVMDMTEPVQAMQPCPNRHKYMPNWCTSCSRGKPESYPRWCRCGVRVPHAISGSPKGHTVMQPDI